MTKPTRSDPLQASTAPTRGVMSVFPAVFAKQMELRQKRPLGDAFGLQAFGVNHTRLLPGAVSALHHRHTKQDEFVYVLEGTPTLVTDAGEVILHPGMCVGFAANGTAHHLENRSERDVVLLEVGDRPAGDAVDYPNDDLQAVMGDDGKWTFVHKDGTPY
jgi:uncharacterized cupin superfamily protein